MSGDAKLFGGAHVVVRERVGDERTGAGGDGGQDEGVSHQGRPHHCGVGLLVGSALGQEAQQCIVQGTSRCWWLLVGPSLATPSISVRLRADGEHSALPVDVRPPQGAQLSSAGASHGPKMIASASMGDGSSAAAMSLWTSVTSGAETVVRVNPGGVGRSAGLTGTMPHLTARSRAAWSTEWNRRTDEGDRPRANRSW